MASNIRRIKREIERTLKKKKFTTLKCTIGEYCDVFYAAIDCLPLGQRLPILQGLEIYGDKAKDIISCIFEGEHIGVITLVMLSDTEVYEFEFESIDGGHRKRYIFAYVDNQFSVDGKFFKDLTSEEQEEFLNYDLDFCVYKPLSVFRKGEIFRNLNTSTDVNFIEMLNSFGNIPIANLIRETVRVVQQIANTCHELFEMSVSGKANRYLDFINNRLVHDHMFARIVYRYTQDEYLGGSSDEPNLSEMYKDESLDISKLKTKSKVHLDFLLHMAVARNNSMGLKLSKREFKMLSYVWFHLLDTYKTFKITDYDKFYNTFKTAFEILCDNKGKYATGEIEVENEEGDTEIIQTDCHKFDLDFEERAISLQDAFVKYLSGDFGNDKKTIQTVTWLLMEFDLESVIIPLDKKRAFTWREKERKLTEQEFKCAIDGENLLWPDAHAAHIDAHSLGNPTVYSNLAMVRKKYNLEMKTMSVTQYKEERMAIAA
jgi:hypothetical protein